MAQITILQGSYHDSHFTDGEMEAREGLVTYPKSLHLVKRAQVCLAAKPMFFLTLHSKWNSQDFTA